MTSLSYLNLGDSSEDFPHLNRYQEIENNQKSSISESSDEESTHGCIAWSRKESSKDKHLSSITDSSSAFSSLDDSLSSSSSNENDNETTKKRTVSGKFKEFEDTDESVIFAENSTEQLKNESEKQINSIKHKRLVKKAAAKSKLSENVDESDQLNQVALTKREFIYIQVKIKDSKKL